MPAVELYSPTGDPYIDGLLDGVKWATTSLSFSFPTDPSFYEGSAEAQNNFEAFTATQQNAVRKVLEQISSVSGLSFNEVTDTSSVHGTVRYAETDATDTAYAYTPHPSEAGGDSWYNNSSNAFENPVKGTWAYNAFLHETGHALGLKHPHSQEGAFQPMPVDRDSTEYSVMSYRSYIGAPVSGGGYTNGFSSFPQTLMMLDIAALQELYGANYTTNSGNTVYSWSPLSGEMFVNGIGQQAPAGNKIFMTIWDGGGQDTYDFSNYANAVSVMLQPGDWSICSEIQRANLGNGHYAAGNIANALLYDNNPASLIENAICGAGTDSITGNIADNRFTGGGGNDTLTGAAGADTAIYSGLFENYGLARNTNGSWSITDLRTGSPDGIDTLWSMEFCEFDDMTYGLGAPPPPPSDFDGDGKSDVLWQNDDGRAAVWLVNGTTLLNSAVVGPTPGPDWHIKGTGDFNQNDRSDIVWQNNDGRVAIWFLNGLSLVSYGVIANNPGPSWHVIDTGHFNADGKSDLLWQNNDGRVAVWTLDGTTQTGGVVVGENPGPSWHVKASGDFNGDGQSDIVWQNTDGRAAVWILDGMNFVQGAVVSDNPGPSWHIKDSGDFNGDGKSDILWQNDDGRAAIWLVDGLSFVSGSVVGSNPGPAWQAESAADYNGDGKADILWQHDNGQAGIWLMVRFGILDSDLVGPNPGTAWHVDWI